MSSRGPGSFALALALLTVSVGRANAQPDEVIQAIEKAWKAREERLKTVRFEWVQDVTYKRGGLTHEYKLRSKDTGEALPTADYTYQGTNVLVLDEKKMRCEIRREAFSAATQTFIPWNEDAVWDGASGLSYEDQPALPIKSSRRERGELPHGSFKTPDVFPALHNARPLRDNLNFIRLDDFRSAGRKATIQGAECLELDRRKPLPSGRQGVWVDPKRDYVIVRHSWTTTRNGKLVDGSQTDIQYQLAAPGLWLPSSWVITRQGVDGDISSIIKARVTKAELDPKPPASHFDTEPPRNSFHTEFGADRTYTQFIVRKDGSKAPVTDANRTERIQELKGEIPSPETAGWSRRNRYLLFAGGAVALLVGLGAVRWRLRARARPRPDPAG